MSNKKKSPMTGKDAKRIIKKGKDDGFKKRAKKAAKRNNN